LDVFRRHVLCGIEITHFAGDLGREGAGVEMRDRADAAPALADIAPRRHQIVADRRDDAQTSYHYASFHTGVWIAQKRKLRRSGAAFGETERSARAKRRGCAHQAFTWA